MYTRCTGLWTHSMCKKILTSDPESPVYPLTSQLPEGLQVFRTLLFRAKCS
uniref:Uncharacterized protein n=1 Tax=Cebus imitator TaxID=2715852 RepID=A0A2K5PAV7_CEBIM